ncbi:hypothetical protein Peur_003645 [Populus x canadensis]
MCIIQSFFFFFCIISHNCFNWHQMVVYLSLHLSVPLLRVVVGGNLLSSPLLFVLFLLFLYLMVTFMLKLRSVPFGQLMSFACLKRSWATPSCCIRMESS